MSMSKRELYQKWCDECNNEDKNNAVINYVHEKFKEKRNEIHDFDTTVLKVANNFLSHLRYRWKKCNRTKKTFENHYCDWLNSSIDLEPQDGCETEIDEPSSAGRPPKPFSDLSDKSKKRRIDTLMDSYTHEELMYAARSSLYSAGYRDASTIIKEISQSPEKASQMKKNIMRPEESCKKYSPDEALSLYIDGRLSKYSYIIMQKGAKQKQANIYPSYSKVLKAKKDCYPDPECIKFTETSAEVRLQALVDHTSTRLATSLKEVVKNTFPGEQYLQLNLFYKWGCDGSSGHSTYKMKFENGEDSKTDAHVYSVCLVPLQLTTVDKKQLIWNNNRACSTRFCRPIKIIFKKENPELIKNEISVVTDQIQRLVPTTFTIDDHQVEIFHDMKMTMIDGKTFGVFTETSVQSCGICGATPSIMNNLNEVLNRKCDEEKYDMGISSLHAYIRCLECILHISYRREVKRWRITDQVEKSIVKDTKSLVKNTLRKEMGILVDIPKPGYGTTNDGNTAAMFFLNYRHASSITGVDENLIRRLSSILQCISSGFSINVDKFSKFTRETAELYVELYPWYPMPQTLHKLLIHATEVIKSTSVPIGMLSEEALEARNKDIRRFREHHTRKCSRRANVEDLLHSLLFTSDPLISLLSDTRSKCHKKKLEPFSEEVRNLLSEPAIHDFNDFDSDDDDDDDANENL